MLNFYTVLKKIYNVIPTSNNIIPVLEIGNKGDSTEPQNYRPIMNVW